MNNFIIDCVIEIPKHSKYKYEIDESSGTLMIDRVLNQEIPHNYGFVANTLCEDEDALDIFVISKDPIHPTAVVRVEIFGAYKCTDDGFQDDKLLGVVVGEEDVHNIEAAKWQIKTYLESYKPNFKVDSFLDASQAEAVYLQSLIDLEYEY